jgi:nucleotide-binding universal stress UspA family protein
VSLEHEIMSREIQRAEMPSRHVVMGYDGSELARAALALAGKRAGPRGRIVAVYATAIPADVVTGMPPPTPPPAPPEELGQRILAEVDEAATGGVPVTTRSAVGSAARALVEVARNEDADEIVVGSHGAGRLRALLGSTSHALVHEADRPVVVLTERAAHRAAGAGEPARLIVLGYDGSEDAKAALAYARRHLAPGGAILAVHAYHAPAEWKGTRYYNEALQERLLHGQRLLDAIDAGPEVSGELIPGAPAAVLAELAASRDADEIVVGSRGLGTLRAALGSVAHGVLHEADRPVVIVPRPSDTA